MKAKEKLIAIKSIHTLIWFAYVVIIFYILYAALIDRIDTRFWIAVASVIAEGIILIANHWRCPLTVAAKRYSQDASVGFDIFIPRWLAKHNKTIFTTLFVIAMVIAAYRIVS